MCGCYHHIYYFFEIWVCYLLYSWEEDFVLSINNVNTLFIILCYGFSNYKGRFFFFIPHFFYLEDQYFVCESINFKYSYLCNVFHICSESIPHYEYIMNIFKNFAVIKRFRQPWSVSFLFSFIFLSNKPRKFVWTFVATYSRFLISPS